VATAGIDSQLLQHFIEKKLLCNSRVFGTFLLWHHAMKTGTSVTKAGYWMLSHFCPLFVTAGYDYWIAEATAGYLVSSHYCPAVASCRGDGKAVTTA
jgi:hypothetical protein